MIDEIQKIQNWSETVKKLWDQDRLENRPMHVILSGSSSLDLEKGIGESLAGRFEIIPAIHWTWPMFNEATRRSFDEFIYFGGYPGSYDFINDEERWRSYIQNAIIEPVLAKDILLHVQINKPALLRRLFQLGADFSGQVLSLQKATGQLQDAGNTTTLSHYIDILERAFLLSGLQKIETHKTRLRAFSPKFMVHNSALMSAIGNYSFDEARSRPEIWGRYLESAVGAFLVNQKRLYGFEVMYWRHKNDEIDFVVQYRGRILGLEIKTSHKSTKGLTSFRKVFPDSRCEVLDYESGSAAKFLCSNVIDYF